MGSEAEALNKTIQSENKAIYQLLSKKGKDAYFPKAGILSQSAEAKGKRINATIGIALEDDGSPMCLQGIASKVALAKKDVFPYAPGPGKPELRAAWKELMAKKNPSLKTEVSNPVTTSALTHGLSVAGQLFIDEGDSVIMPDQYWENYDLVLKHAYGAEFALFPSFAASGFNLEGFEEALTKTKGKTIVLLNFPNNPTGYTPTAKEAQAMAQALTKHAEQGSPTLVLCDDAYFGFFYTPDACKESLFALLAGASRNLLAVKIDGPTKEDYVWGLRVGFITYGIKGGSKELYEALESKTAGTVRGTISMAPHLSQSLIAGAMGAEGYEEEKREKFKTMQERYDEVRKTLKNNPQYAEEFEPLPYNSGYFMCVQVKQADAETVRKTLLEQHDTGVIAQGKLLRLAYSAIGKDKIPLLFENIYRACKASHKEKKEAAATMDYEKLMDEASKQKLKAISNPHVERIIEKYAQLCKPSRIIVVDGSKEDLDLIRKKAIEKGEEAPLRTTGHTVHFDGYNDQGREPKNTRVLLPKGKTLSKSINVIDKDEGLQEVLGLMDGIMAGKDMLVGFFCLGPANSPFSIHALQLTDSYYVMHSETILYRAGYEEFKRIKGGDNFFHFIHSAGALDSRNNTKDITKRRIYMDLEDERVFTLNNQYAGNSVGLKKLALRLAISKANKEDWLCEHMFVMGAHKDGKTAYFTGAFPSACGKTSTAMIPGQSIIGDDIAYIRRGEDGRAYAANVEQGIFGIIQDINPVDDPVIHKALTSPRELIMSNVLVKDQKPYWLGMGQELPTSGNNYAGEWQKGMVGPDGKEALPAHKNARYTIRIEELENADKDLNNPQGVPISGIIYGGRDSDTSPPVIESLSWAHGVFIGAAIESETTAAKIGAEGVRVHDPMANMDFLVIPLGKYIANHLKFGSDLDECPRIFATNYFLKEDGKFLNEKVDKKVWLLWMVGRVHDEYEGIDAPIGIIPKYEDLKALFKKVFNKDYTKEEYVRQFSLRTDKLLERLERIENIYAVEEGVPEEFHLHLKQQRQRLLALRKEKGKDVVSPLELE